MSVRLVILILNAVFFKNSNSNHELVSWISTPRTTKFEDSGSPEICTTNSWVGGMRLKIDSTQGWRDDKGLNAIQLHCVKMDWIYSGHITSASGPWGDYQKSKFCPHGFATGYQLRSEIEAIDDFGVVDFKLKCTNFDGTTSYVINSEYALPWDTCCSEQNCPSKTAVCGLSTQVEVNQGNGRYDCTSSLNNVKLACCKIPDPAETCELEIKWKTVTVCPEARKMCEIKLRTGFVENKKLSKFAKFYKQLGFAIDFQFVQKTFKMKAKNNATYLINGKSLESIIGDTIIYQNKVSLQLNCEGMMQQLIVMCGSYKAYTKEYRCVPNSGQGRHFKGGLFFQPSSSSENILWSYNCNFNGGNITKMKSRSEDCGDFCYNEKQCTHFTWTTDQNGTCWMKENGVNLTPIEKYDKDFVCGWIERI